MRNPRHIPAMFAGQMDSLAIFGASNYIFVPPEVEIVLWRPASLSLPENRGYLCIQYPVPQHWYPVIKNPGFSLLDLIHEEFENSDMPLSDQFLKNLIQEAFVKRGNSLCINPIDKGWKVIEKFDGLDDFLKLADEELTYSGVQKVKKFVEKWGPLWVCVTPSHHTRDVITGSPLGFCYGLRYTQPTWGGETCSWRPLEHIAAFLKEAKRAKALLEAAAELDSNRLIPEHIRKSSLIPSVAATSRPYSIQDDRLNLYVFLRDLLTHYGDLYIRPKISRYDYKPKVELRFNDGFIYAVWIQIFQLVCNIKGFCQCSNCRKYYLRETRREKEGQDNYCPACGPEKNYKVSKKNTWNKNKNKYNARRLYRKGVSIDEISRKLNTNQETVKEWISTASKNRISNV